VGAAPDSTERLSFRTWTDGDADAVLDLYSRPEVYRFLGASPGPVTDPDAARARIARWAERTKGLAGVWAIETRRAPGTPIGTALLVPLTRTDGAPSEDFEIGWHLHPDAWGQGYATEAATALLERARAGGLAEVRAVVRPDNEPSKAVCRRLGMREVGLTREWYGVDVIEYLLDLSAPDSPHVLAARIAAARAANRMLPAPVDHGLAPADAYQAQGLVLAERLEHGGGRGGWKLGYTSRVMREQMGVAEPNFGPLARAMVLPSGSVVDAGVTQPRVEPELAAVLGSDVPMDATVDEIRDAVAAWRIALEVVDSVWEGYRFDWALNTADGSSAGFVILGDPVGSRDLPKLEVTLERDDVTVGQGRGDAAMGDPVAALAWLVARLAERGDRLRADDVVITGGLTAAVPFERGSRIVATAGPATASVVRSP
jgi:2-keto-4-pentenoate hydratase/RimJ/RimL family protein N-acetyltransferase